MFTKFFPENFLRNTNLKVTEHWRDKQEKNVPKGPKKEKAGVPTNGLQDLFL